MRWNSLKLNLTWMTWSLNTNSIKTQRLKKKMNMMKKKPHDFL
jgi:hypothetical protein